MSDPDSSRQTAHPSTIEAEAAAWVARMDGERWSEPDRLAFEEWRSRSEQHAAAAARLGKLWSQLDVLNELAKPAAERVAAPRKFLRVGQWEARARLVPGAIAAVAAAVSIVCGISFLAAPPSTVPLLQTYQSAVGMQKTITLADGSRVLLNTGSRIDVRMSRRARDLRLASGEAFFEVAADRARPFSVYAGDGVVRAVGTAFAVRVQTQAVEVTVTHGDVELEALVGATASAPLEEKLSHSRQRLATMGAGERALFDTHVRQRATVAQSELDRRLAWRQGLLVFAGDPLASVIADVSRYTDMHIEIADPRLNDVRVNGRFKVGEVAAMLEVLETSFGVRVERSDDTHVRLFAAS